MFLKNAGCDNQRTRRCTMVMVAGGLTRQPANHPYVVVRAVMYSLKPAVLCVEPNPFHPTCRGQKLEDDVRKFLGRFDRCPGSHPRFHDRGPNPVPYRFIHCHAYLPNRQKRVNTLWPLNEHIDEYLG